MELGADEQTSDRALLGHATVIVLLGSAASAATDGILLDIEPGIVANTAADSMKLMHLMVVQIVQSLV